MTWLAVIAAVNVAFAAMPPYGWMNVLNGVCAVALLVTMAAVSR